MTEAAALRATWVLCAVMSMGSASAIGLRVKTGQAPWGVESIRCDSKPQLEFVRPGRALGEVAVRFRGPGGEWTDLKAGGQTTEVATAGAKLRLKQEFSSTAGRLQWSIALENRGVARAEVGDLAISLPMNDVYTRSPEETFERRVMRHAFISGEGSWVYWQPAGGGGPFLLMSAAPGTGLEFFTAGGMDYARGDGEYAVYVHSAAYAAGEKRGSWRQKRTSLVLGPGERKTYRFAFTAAETVNQLRASIVREGGIDVRVAPGMVVPRGVPVRLALRSALRIDALTAEHPDGTSVQVVPGRDETLAKSAGCSSFAL